MSQNHHNEIARKDAILTAALPLFLKNGYEKTSMRMIASGAGCEVGLVYYYFETKEEIFDRAIEMYFSVHQQAMDALSNKATGNAEAFFELLFDYLEAEAPALNKTFDGNVHWTVCCAVRTKFADLILPFVLKALDGIASLPYPKALTAKMLCDLLVPAALGGELSANKEALRAVAGHLLGNDKAVGKRRDIPSFLL